MEDSAKFKGLAFVVVFIANWVWTASVPAQSDFYKGKTITVYVGTTPGALYDQWSRLLAQYMGKHIPGNPTMIVQNMPGAGHMIAANYLYNRT
jgi:tripartite-type tricarboxylate transporter receptor subunit TctC